MPNLPPETPPQLIPALCSAGLVVVSVWLLRVLMRLIDIWTGAARRYWRLVAALSVGVGLWAATFLALLSAGGAEPIAVNMGWQGAVYLCTALVAVLASMRVEGLRRRGLQLFSVGLLLAAAQALSLLSVRGASVRPIVLPFVLVLSIALAGGIVAVVRSAPGVLETKPPRWNAAPSLLLSAGLVILLQGAFRFALVPAGPGTAGPLGMLVGPIALGSGIILLLTAMMVSADERNRAFTFTVAEQSRDALITIGSDGHLIYLSPPAQALVRRPREELIGKQAWEVFPASLSAALRGPVEARTSGAVSGTGEIHDEETGHWYELAVHPWPDYVAIVLRDVTGRHLLEEQIRYQALHDPLTGLANRAAFQQRLAEVYAAARLGGEPPVMLMLDLDGFKHINDTLGHPAGDQVLIAFARRLRTSVPDGELIARLGGDEMAILLSRGGLDGAVTVAEQVIAAMREPLQASEQAIHVSVSIGLTEVAPGGCPDDLMREADRALYEAKAKGKGCYAVYRHEETPATVQP